MLLAILSGIFALAFYYDVFTDALKGKIKPNPSSWFIWSLNDSLILVASWSAGAYNTLVVPFVYAIFGWAILAVTIKNNPSKLSLIEIVCLTGSTVSWVLYFLIPNPLYSLIIAVIVNAIGCLPTMAGLWRDPKRESFRSWSLLLVASILSITSLEHYKFALLLFPISSLILIVVINLLILRKSPASLDITVFTVL